MNRINRTNSPRIRPVLAALVFSLAIGLSAQDFGFGFDDAPLEDKGSTTGVTIGGEVGMALLGYTDDLRQGLGQVWRPGRIDARLNFTAHSAFGEGVVNLKLNPAGFITQLQGEPDAAYHGFTNIIAFDEVYARAWFSDFELEAGMRKLTWGKADSLGPLDVINPLDYSELTSLDDLMRIKIAVALIHSTWRFGPSAKLETVFVPVFEPWHFAEKGRWVPAQFATLAEYLESLAASLPPGTPVPTPTVPDTTTLDYFQGGLRFTTTLGPADLGVQYYYGRMGSPAMRFTPTGIDLIYNPYHQIGADWAQVLLGFNLRGELAANLTGDRAGDDGAVYNPALAWSVGFDRDLVGGVNLNLQVNETVRLRHGSISDNPLLDTEAGTDRTTTRLTAVLSRKFLRDELELRAALLWDLEDRDFLAMPAVVWTKDAVSLEVSGGIFGGNREGQLGQYRDNSFVKVGMGYVF
jgi:hypothetical protein